MLLRGRHYRVGDEHLACISFHHRTVQIERRVFAPQLDDAYARKRFHHGMIFRIAIFLTSSACRATEDEPCLVARR